MRDASSFCVVSVGMDSGPTGFFGEREKPGWRLPGRDYANLSCRISLGRGRKFTLDTELSVDSAVDLMPGDSYD